MKNLTNPADSRQLLEERSDARVTPSRTAGGLTPEDASRLVAKDRTASGDIFTEAERQLVIDALGYYGREPHCKRTKNKAVMLATRELRRRMIERL